MENYTVVYSGGQLVSMPADSVVTIRNTAKIRDFEKVELSHWLRDFKGHFPKEVYGGIKLPERATVGSAGYDFFAPFPIELYPGEEIVIPSGVKAYMLWDEFLDIRPRSGQGFKYLRVANTTPIIDSDYYNNEKTGGHIMIKLRNENRNPRGIIKIEKGQGYCQAIFSKYLVTDSDNTKAKAKRIGGIGSTD